MEGQNIMMRRLFVGLFATMFLVSVTNGSQAIEQLTWRDLVVAVEPLEDPYNGLDYDQRIDLDVLLTIERMRQADGLLPEDYKSGYEDIYTELESAGFDPDALIEKYEAYKVKVAELNSSVREDRDGTDIRIPGYVLPLEYDGEQVTEFLLVPYVGACIHTPPPPANQIIHVKPNASFRAKGMFTPVWVTGKLTIERSQQSVGLSDGVGGFEVGYQLQAEKVEKYTD